VLAIWGRCVIVTTCARPASRRSVSATACAADARVDLVEDERLAAGDGCEGERDARELAARGRLRDWGKRQTGVRSDQEDGVVGAGRAGVARPDLDVELAVSEPEPAQLGGHGFGERSGGRRSRRAELAVDALELALGLGGLGGCGRGGIDSVGEVGQLASGGLGALDQVGERVGSEAATQVREPIELSLDVLEAPRVGIQ